MIVERLPRSLCVRCGQKVAVGRSGHLRKHACPHGRPCKLGFEERMRGDRAPRCAECFADRQLGLFG